MLGIDDLTDYFQELEALNRTAARKKAMVFYKNLFAWTAQGKLALKFICPTCEKELGVCRCVGRGRKAGRKGQWWYYNTGSKAAHWKLDADSLLAISGTKRFHGIQNVMIERLYGFINFVKAKRRR